MEHLEKIIDLLRSGGELNIELSYHLAKSQEAGSKFYYLLQFGRMLDYLRSFQNIEIIEFDFKAPNPEKIEDTECNIGMPLDKGLKRFYSQCDGMSIQWRFTNPDKIKNLIDIDGMFEIPGIEELYGNKPSTIIVNNSSIVLYGTEISKEEICKYFLKFEENIDFEVLAFTGSGFKPNPLLFISDESANYFFDSRTIHIPAYIELLFHCCGSIEAREKLLRKHKGYKLPIALLDSDWFEQHHQPDFSSYPPTYFYPETLFYKNVEF